LSALADVIIICYDGVAVNGFGGAISATIGGMKGYMTLAELATRLGIQAASLRVQVHRGALQASKEGRDWFVSDEEATRYEKEQAGKKGTASPRHSRVGNRQPRRPTPPEGGTPDA